MHVLQQLLSKCDDLGTVGKKGKKEYLAFYTKAGQAKVVAAVLLEAKDMFEELEGDDSFGNILEELSDAFEDMKEESGVVYFTSVECEDIDDDEDESEEEEDLDSEEDEDE